MPLEEEIINLQKDLVVYILFSDGIEKAENSLLPWYSREFEYLIQAHGSISEAGLKDLIKFFQNAALLVENPIVYDGQRVRQELVTVFSSPGFTQAVMSASQKFSESERDKAREILNGLMHSCIEKSKNPEDLQKILAAKALISSTQK